MIFKGPPLAQPNHLQPHISRKVLDHDFSRDMFQQTRSFLQQVSEKDHVIQSFTASLKCCGLFQNLDATKSGIDATPSALFRHHLEHYLASKHEDDAVENTSAAESEPRRWHKRSRWLPSPGSGKSVRALSAKGFNPVLWPH